MKAASLPDRVPDLLPARGQRRTPALDAAVAPDAWRREMEKAQSAMWLGHQPIGVTSRVQTAAAGTPAVAPPDDALAGGAAGHARAAPPAASRHGEPQPQAPASIASRQQPALAPALPATLEDEGREQPPVSAAVWQAVLSAVRGVLESRVERVERTVASEPARQLATQPALPPSRMPPSNRPAASAGTAPARPVPAETPDPQAVHVHCQLTAEGLVVWVGAAAGSGFDPQALGAQLRQALARHSQRLAGLVCNGHQVPIESVFFPPLKEPTWPLDQ